MGKKRIVLGLALFLGVVLLARWAMRSDDSASVPQHAGQVVPSDVLPDAAQPSAISGAGRTDTKAADASAAKPTSEMGTLRGRVIDAITRGAVREFEIEFHYRQGGRPNEKTPGKRSFRTTDGQFEWHGLPAERWTVTASARGYQRFQLMDLQIPKGAATSQLILPLRTGYQLRGRVYDEATAEGIAAAVIAFREADAPRFGLGMRLRSAVHAAQDGTFSLEGVPPGRVTLQVRASDHAERELDVVVGSDNAPLEIGLSAGGMIAGYLAASYGATPVAGTVSLTYLDEGRGTGTHTGPAGEFSYRNLAAGRYRLTGQSSSGGASRDVVLASNQRIEGIVLTLNPERRVRGVVSGVRPEELPQLSIALRPERGGIFSGTQATPDTRGTFDLQGVPPGRAHVTAEIESRRSVSKAIVVPADADITVNLEFPPGVRLSGRVTRGGKPLPDTHVEPQPVAEQTTYSYGRSTSKDGTYVIEDLAPGEYELWVDTYRSGPVQVAGDTVFDIDVPAAQLSGRVTEAGGKVPVVGASVDMRAAEPGSKRLPLRTRSDHFGQFSLVGLEPGDFLLSIYKSGYEMHRERISYDAPLPDMTVGLRQAKGVEIRVRAAGSGEALRRILAFELAGAGSGSRFDVHLDDNGVGYLPTALAGSRLLFRAPGYTPAMIRDWSGEPLNLQLTPAESD